MDQPDVVNVKKTLLGRMGAALENAENATARFPLKASQLHQVGANFEEMGWSHALIEMGLARGKSTLWHAEGLLNYLTANAVRSLLVQASKVHKLRS